MSRLHVGIIMDGNGRWATSRGLPRRTGHREGARALRRVVEAAPDHGIDTLTVYAFSADNWRRPAAEVRGLMGLFRSYLRHERRAASTHGVAVSVIGRRDRLPAALRREIDRMEAETRRGARLRVRVAVDYSARDAIVRAARQATLAPALDQPSFESLLAAVDHGPPAPPVDLLIRTGGEQRLSDFLLWESAYAELYFTDTMWPDFGPAELAAALTAFQRRERRFGGLTPAAGAA